MKYITAGLAALLMAGCSKQDSVQPDRDRITVYAVNYPLAWMAERLADDKASVVFPDMDGDPAFWEPGPEQIADFQDADLILLNGASYAKWVPKVSLPQSRLVDTSIAFKDRYIALDDTVTHTHGPGGAHAHGDIAFTTWLDPQLAARQAAAIFTALERRGMTESAAFQSLQADLAGLDTELEAAFAKLGDQPLLGSHPVYQYLVRRYGLSMESVHWEPDAEPDETMWRDLEDILEAHPAGIMLWEGEPTGACRAKLAARGIECVVFDPCGNRPDSGDFLSVMEQNLNNLSR